MKNAVKKALLVALTLLVCFPGMVSCVVRVSKSPAGAADPVLQRDLRRRVDVLCSSPRFGESLGRAQAWIAGELRAAGWEVRLQEFENKEGKFANVVAERKGKEAGRYIIGAHYDACDSLPDAVNPGADDNASAVAVLLEVAKRLPQNPRYTVELVFYACEEPPWFGTPGMGSAHHAASCRAGEVRGMICLEMLGCFRHDGTPGESYFPGSRTIFPRKDDFVAIIGDFGSLSLARKAYASLRRRMPTVRINLPFAHDTILWFSDHRNYAPLGIPSIMITDTSMLRNKNYHEATDTPDSLCYHCMAHITEAVASLIRRLAYL